MGGGLGCVGAVVGLFADTGPTQAELLNEAVEKISNKIDQAVEILSSEIKEVKQ